MTHRVLLYINKPAWDENHPFRKTTTFYVKDFEARDTYKFVSLIQETTRTKMVVSKLNDLDLKDVPLPLRDVVKFKVHGVSEDGSKKVLGWLTDRPKYWSYVIGVIRKSEAA